ILPEIKYNLLSIAKLTNEMDCIAVFSSSDVVFQDRKSKRRIGRGLLVDGLYRIKFEHCALSLKSSFDSSLWHKRLGHSSSAVMSKLFLAFHFDCNDCETCFFI
ncbi:GAG-pre-integrase domain-containing protein, partial [Klebsiella pneumoniae]|uniref:GAG-pre-integrase domain-containing protein n=1 Tax=Klebsiella pneumoniae TaxID=573 RepID=UPI003A808212